jgi:hypothetical protein
MKTLDLALRESLHGFSRKKKEIKPRSGDFKI